MIRELRKDDLKELKKIHEKFYKEEFDFPDFFQKFLCAFVSENENGQIVSAGGVRTLTESVFVTNKDIPIKERRDALYDLLHVSLYVCQRNNYDSLHAFIQDKKWLRHLKKVGFNKCKGEAIYIEVL